LGRIDTPDRLARELANTVNAAIVVLNYSRSPEDKCQIALEEIYDFNMGFRKLAYITWMRIE
jgi:acetyl esterase/lipase